MMARTIAPPAAQDAFEHILSRLADESPPARIDRVRSAFEVACELYADRKHWTGTPLIDHTLGVLGTLLPFHPDEDTVVACLLHHALDGFAQMPETIEHKFGSTVRSLVSGVNLLSRVTTRNRRMSIEQLRTMLLKVADDARMLLIILCDRSYLLTHIALLPPPERRRVCADVLQLFAPVAARLGIYTLKTQLEARAFPVVYPTDAVRIEEQIAMLHEREGDFLDKAAEELRTFLEQEGVPARVEGREKQPYSIFLKTRSKGINSVEDLYDLFAFRVIVDSVPACYQALGLLHRIGHPVSNRFKDYLAFPKPNGYQSLHTTLAHLPGVPSSVFVEVQIRTADMHREADYGIAAHWSYKEAGSTAQALQRVRLHKMLSVTQSLHDQIFVLTPRGDIVELPEGATTLDFAFHVHTNLGLSFRAARVNGAIVPLDYQLENGDVVEIQKHRDPRPSPRWLTLLKTASARSHLKRFLALQHRPDTVELGRELLDSELSRRGLPQLDQELNFLHMFDGRELSQEEREDLLLKVGQGSQSASSVLPHLAAWKKLALERQPADHPHVPGIRLQAEIEGGIPMPIRYAKCCKPEGGPISGVIGRTGDVRVHKASCKMLLAVNPERRIAVRWAKALPKKA